MSTSKFPKFVLEEQTLAKYLELMTVAFNAAEITDDALFNPLDTLVKSLA